MIKVFMQELIHQGEAVAICLDQYNDAKAEDERRNAADLVPDLHDVSNRAFLSAQSILTAGALVSKMLWPPGNVAKAKRGRAIERSRAILSALAIDDDIPVLSNRTVRNSFEHFDERLDDYFGEDPDSWVIDRILTKNIDVNEWLASGAVRQVQPHRAFRQLDIGKDTISVLDESVSLREIAAAVIAVGERAQNWIDRYERTTR